MYCISNMREVGMPEVGIEVACDQTRLQSLVEDNQGVRQLPSLSLESTLALTARRAWPKEVIV